MCRLKRSILILLIATVWVTGPLFSQQTSVVTANALRLDLRVLGHPPKDVIPPDESAITSLVMGADGRLYGGTTGEKAHLFVLDPQWGHVVPLGFIPGETSIFHSLAPGLDNSIYIGTSLPMTGRPDARGKDVAAAYSAYKGGHLYRFDTAQEASGQKRMQIPTPQRELPFLTDLGIVVAGEGIISLVRGEGEIYGMTFPNGHFFVCDLETGKIADKGVVCGAPLHEEPFKSVPRALVIDTQSRVWGARDRGTLFHYDPETGELYVLFRTSSSCGMGTGVQNHSGCGCFGTGWYDLRRHFRWIHIPARPGIQNPFESWQAAVAVPDQGLGIQPDRSVVRNRG